MGKQNSEKWLDEIISKTINTTKPQFDAEKFKQKFPVEFRALQSRANKQPIKSVRWTYIFKSPIVKFAAAAVLILSIVFFVSRSEPDEQVDIPEVTNITQSPTDMMSILSLNLAYNRGGLEAVDKQYEKALKKLGPRPRQLTVQELLAEFNGV